MKQRWLSWMGLAGLAAMMVGAKPVLAAPMNGSGIPNPAYNLPVTGQNACPYGTALSTCRAIILQSMNHANWEEGAQALHLPPNYSQLSASERLFVLTNLVRLSFGKPPIAGLNAAANAAAQVGAKTNTDPVLPAHATLDGAPVVAWGGDWAGGFATLEAAMVGWVYDDGPGSDNLDCQPGHMSGCWGHRDDILLNWPAGDLVAGAAAVTVHGRSSVTLLPVVTSAPVPLTFTWQHELKTYPSGASPVTPFPSTSPRAAYLGRTAGWTSRAYWVNHGTRYPLPTSVVQGALMGGALPLVTWPHSPALPVGVPAVVPYPNGTFLRVQHHRAIYWINHGVLHHVTSLAAFHAAGGHLWQVRAFPRLPASWPIGAPESVMQPHFAQGALVRFGATPAVYVYEQGMLRHIANPTVFHENGWSWGAVQERPVAAQDGTVHGPAITGLVPDAMATGSVVRVQGQRTLNVVVHGTFRPVSSALLKRLGGSLSSIRTVPHPLPMGHPLG